MEELNTALATLIEQATTGIDASVGFLQAELPDVVYQLLLWHGIKSALFCLVALLLLLVPYLVIKRLKAGFKKFNPEKSRYEYKDQEAISEWQYAEVSEYAHTTNTVYVRERDVAGIYQVVGAVLSVTSVVLSGIFINLTWLQIWIAPKVWLLEYAAKLVS